MATRIDNFIVWGHGIQYIREIMCTLRDNFEIIVIHRKEISDMPKFVNDIYECDTYPLYHLKAKTRYLMTVPKEIISVTVRNHNVQERESGSGAFRGVQCDHVCGVKRTIRKKFNPPGTEHHVIHGTDYESQVEHILNVIGEKTVAYYTKNKPYHIPARDRQSVLKDVDELFVNILGKGAVRASETPYFAYMNGDVKAYEDYFFPRMGKELKEDHFPEAFDRLIEYYNETPPPIIDGNMVLDGGHRVAIAKFKGIKAIICLQ